METWDDRQPHKNKQHILQRKTWAHTYLAFFLFLICLYTRSPRFGARKLSSFASSLLVFYRSLHLIASCRQLSKGHKLSSHFRLSCRVGSRNIKFPPNTHACTQDFGPPVFLNHFQLQQVPQPCYSATTVWFIYLFIHSLIQVPMSCPVTLHFNVFRYSLIHICGLILPLMIFGLKALLSTV